MRTSSENQPQGQPDLFVANQPPKLNIRSEPELVALCFALLEDEGLGCLSAAEQSLAKIAPASALGSRCIDAVRTAISGGADPLGEAFSFLRSPIKRREAGAIYTPLPIVGSMIHWLATQGTPARIVDPGAGSVALSWPQAKPSRRPTLSRSRWTRWLR